MFINSRDLSVCKTEAVQPPCVIAKPTFRGVEEEGGAEVEDPAVHPSPGGGLPSPEG
jgi:hypothetical protein